MEITEESQSYLASFFHLKEDPFALTPDPKYLYLGDKHREVMGHLLYSVRESKGFMVVVGEVGTGKTTLCRAFINQLLKDKIEVGLIYNPALTDLELLQGINREFKISSDFNSKGKLIDALNDFLLRINREGRKVVLIIDEAQNLSPSVLEQIRLISNLETETGKLIQIILVGQPELEKILSREDLRQLDQRIAVRGLLGSFNLRETKIYIRHRINVAAIESGTTVSFTDRACQMVHAFTGGIPRLINLLADRALLVAFAEGERKVTKSMVKKADQDLNASRYRVRTKRLIPRWQTAALFCILTFLSLGLIFEDSIKTKVADQNQIQHEKQILRQPSKQSPQHRFVEKDENNNPEKTIESLTGPLSKLSKSENWRLALQALLKLWGYDREIEPGVSTRRLLEGTKFNLSQVYGNINRLKSQYYPVIVELKTGKEDSFIYVVLKKLTGNHAILVGKKEMKVPLEIFRGFWHGRAFILWKDFKALPKSLYPGSTSPEVAWLQKQLGVLNLYSGQEEGFYGPITKTAVMKLQKGHNLYPDGIFGPQTKMMLYSMLDVYEKPSLWVQEWDNKGEK